MKLVNYIRSRIGMMGRGEFDWHALAVRWLPSVPSVLATASPTATWYFWGMSGFVPFVAGILFLIGVIALLDQHLDAL